MGKNMNAAESRTTTVRLPRGRAASIGIVVATKAFTLVAMLVAYYVITFFAAIRVVPLTMGFVKSGSGVTLDMPIETVLSVWIVPALFLVGLVFVLLLVAMRALWRLRIRAVQSVSRWAFGEETGEIIPTEPAGITAKKTPNKTRTKTA